MSDIPILYAYIYRNILKNCNGRKIIDTQMAVNSLRKIIYKAPRTIYREIFIDLINMGLLKQLNKREYFIILSNKECKKKLRRLREYVFPLNPS